MRRKGCTEMDPETHHSAHDAKRRHASGRTRCTNESSCSVRRREDNNGEWETSHRQLSLGARRPNDIDRQHRRQNTTGGNHKPSVNMSIASPAYERLSTLSARLQSQRTVLPEAEERSRCRDGMNRKQAEPTSRGFFFLETRHNIQITPDMRRAGY